MTETEHDEDVWDDTPEGAPLRYGAARPHAKKIDQIRHSHAYKKARASFRAECKLAKKVCHLCGEDIDYRLQEPHPYSWTLDHIKPVQDNPELIMERNNWAASHRDCNVRRGTDEPALDLGVPSEIW